MHIHEGGTIIVSHLLAPLCDVIVVAALDILLVLLLIYAVEITHDLAFSLVPLIAWSERKHYWNGSFFLTVLYHLVEIPAVGIDHEVLSIALQVIDMRCILCASYDSTLLILVDTTDILPPNGFPKGRCEWSGLPLHS